MQNNYLTREEIAIFRDRLREYKATAAEIYAMTEKMACQMPLLMDEIEELRDPQIIIPAEKERCSVRIYESI